MNHYVCVPLVWCVCWLSSSGPGLLQVSVSATDQWEASPQLLWPIRGQLTVLVSAGQDSRGWAREAAGTNHQAPVATGWAAQSDSAECGVISSQERRSDDNWGKSDRWSLSPPKQSALSLAWVRGLDLLLFRVAKDWQIVICHHSFFKYYTYFFLKYHQVIKPETFN